MKKGEIRTCPYCGGNNTIEQNNIDDMNAYSKTVINCMKCDVLFTIRDDGDGEYINKRDQIFNCDICKKVAKHKNSIILDGEVDFYQLEACDKCHELYSNDYFSPKEVDEMIIQ